MNLKAEKERRCSLSVGRARAPGCTRHASYTLGSCDGSQDGPTGRGRKVRRQSLRKAREQVLPRAQRTLPWSARRVHQRSVLSVTTAFSGEETKAGTCTPEMVLEVLGLSAFLWSSYQPPAHRTGVPSPPLLTHDFLPRCSQHPPPPKEQFRAPEIQRLRQLIPTATQRCS